jgi:flagellar hook protein FlgE
MMRSLFSGVSGLKTHQTRMDVIGNNIANVNTTAYKSKSINFSDMLYQTTQSATAPNSANNTAGTNARQIGLGVKTGAINTSITTEGSSQSTGNPFDLKITGEAFFVVTDGTNQYFTRDGSFDVDADGNLCMASTGYIVEGWTSTDKETGAIIQDSVKPIKVLSASNETYPASNTTTATVSGIIDKYDDQLETDNGKLMNIQVLDDKGYEYNLKFGITPSTVSSNTTRSITNTENEYKLPATLYKVDTSTLTYTYNSGTDTLSSTDSPEIMDALEEAVWKAVSGSTNLTVNSKTGSLTDFGITVNSYTVGDSNSNVTVDLEKFLTQAGYSGSVLTNSALNSIHDLKVSFSGTTGYVQADTAPTYPLDTTQYSPVTLSDDVVSTLYDVGTTTGGVAECKIKTDNANITVLKQTYSDDDDNTQTDYTFKDVNGAKITALTSSMSSDVNRILGMGTQLTTQNVYITQESVPDNAKVEDGKYILTLLDITDSDGKEPDTLSNLMNNATTSWTISYSTDDGSFDYVGSVGSDTFTLSLSSLGGNFSNVTFDMSNTSNVNNGGKSTIAGSRDDGYKVGNLSGVSIGQDGTITANYDNGMTKAIAQISVATFANSMGLENVGDNLYQQTSNSGEFDGVGVDIKGSGTGYMTTGVLEMSNVDLSQEFTDMITTQRGFQANSRVITVSDTLLEELVNLKR